MNATHPLLPGFERFLTHQADHVPEVPGIYAWYGTIDAGPRDYEMQLVNGKDVGEVHCRNLLREHSSRYAGASLAIEAESGFAAKWTGQLVDNGNRTVQFVLKPDAYDFDEAPTSATAPKLQHSLESPQLRHALIQALGHSTPIFSAPIYIGVAENLRQRIGQHVRLMEKLWDLVSSDKTKLDKVLSNPKLRNEFGVRAIERGFTVETVEVWVMDFSKVVDADHSDADLRVVAEAAEWLLNRWHRPILGRI